MDYVLPYVDGSDPVWREQYKKANFTGNIEESRFRDFGFLRFALRSVAENMPFIDRVVLIVSGPSQVPDWLDNARVIYHADFMPGEHRPTFSSSAIETDMWRIEGLSGRYIYGNDDIFAMRPMTEADFFEGDKPRLRFNESDYHVQNIFRRSCRNGMDMAADAAGVPRTNPWVLLKPQHAHRPINSRHVREVGEICGGTMNGTVTPHRQRCNITGYIYSYYAYYLGEYADFEKTWEYTRINDDYMKAASLIDNTKADMLCINDAGYLSQDRYGEACRALKESLEKRFPERCRYELF